MKRTVLLLVILAAGHLVSAQGLPLLIRGNLSFGFNYQSVDYLGADLPYSPGGGIGLEIGADLDIARGFSLQPTIGYQQNLSFQYESFNGVSNRSSVSFNRKFLGLAIAKTIPIMQDERYLLAFTGGANYSVPGTLKRIENDEELPDLGFRNAFGYFFDISVRFRLSEAWFLAPGIRYRSLLLTTNSVENGTIDQLPQRLREPNASGIEVGVTFIRK